jgi:hypothetical protein
MFTIIAYHNMVLSNEITARMAFAAAVLEGGGQIATHSNAYSVSQGTSLSFIQHVGSISRTAVKFDTGNTFLGSAPIGITFSFRRVGNPKGVIKTGIRKAVVANDKFSIEYSGSATAGIEIAMNPQAANPTQTATTQQYTGTAILELYSINLMD